MKATCTDIEIPLMSFCNFRQNIVVPNVTPISGLVKFETDLLVLSKSGYATGFEIKVSKSDLKADFKKRQHVRMDKIMYNGKLGFDHYFGPYKYFNYAVPKYLKDDALQLIPKWCGLYIVNKYEIPGLPSVYVERKPKRLFNRKWTEKEMLKLAHLGCMRIYNLK